METLAPRTTWKKLSLEDVKANLAIAEKLLADLPANATEAERISCNGRRAELSLRRMLLEEERETRIEELRTEIKAEPAVIKKDKAATAQPAKAAPANPPAKKKTPQAKEKVKQVHPDTLLDPEPLKEEKPPAQEQKTPETGNSDETEAVEIVEPKIEEPKAVVPSILIPEVETPIAPTPQEPPKEKEVVVETPAPQIARPIETQLPAPIAASEEKKAKWYDRLLGRKSGESKEGSGTFSLERKQNEAVIQAVFDETAKEVDPGPVLAALGMPASNASHIGRMEKFKNMIARFATGSAPKEPHAPQERSFLQKYKGNFIKTGVMAVLLIGLPVALGSATSSAEANFKKDDLKKKTIDTNTKDAFSEYKESVLSSRTDPQLLAELSPNALTVYKYNAELPIHHGEVGPYIIADKDSACLYVFDKDNKLVNKFPAIFGKAIGDTPNRSDVNSALPGSGATTPMGSFHIEASTHPKEITEFQGRIYDLFDVTGTEIDIALHETYPPELVQRTRALNSASTKDNRMSWGCVNISQENFDKYVAPHFTGKSRMYILPDGSSQPFTPAF